MAIKGQRFKSYSEELKLEAIRLYSEAKWTYWQINEHLGIQDKDRMKRWMRKYREQGEFGLLDQRGRRKEYVDQDRYTKQLQRENEMLKKCLEIWKQEVKNKGMHPFGKPHKGTTSAVCASCLVSPQVDTTLI
ncbi:transposase [Paenibacillus sp. oral taxon 786 str. D14]|uniref:helix-turn-helix domain-containing protein n=1 Tax=Paenibacillus sp. oral taxon 786 TaxID=652715 RepID=UPI0001AFDAB1|nr:helix-turn-helix domain-containing protein [Paenibacillus sp. oral taxon 786]EES72069.1 transposase [Paenibacillus sp. oral taxon 786 str. D14]